ncbi:MAG TPA: ribonuclease P protein component [Bacteroidia bacterium]|jgi:ribonuclease P protein component|nr:ribonuclease P protein component [Bacteroidia bacterium]
MQTFSKDERLCSKPLIDQLVQKGNSFNGFPFKVTWLEIQQSTSPVKILISVPKRKFKKAVDRNRIKRLIREAYRKNKHLLIDRLGTRKVVVLLIYTSKTIADYVTVEEKINQALVRLGNEITLI